MIFITTFALCIANTLMLELVEKTESGKNISFVKAMKEVLLFDMPRFIPLAIIWALIWFIIVLIRATIRAFLKRDLEDCDENYYSHLSLAGAAETLSGINDNPLTWPLLGLRMLEKLVRMTVFLCLPAIAWDNKSPISAFRKTLEIIKMHPAQFLISYTLTDFAVFVIAIPLIPYFIAVRSHVDLPSFVLVLVILYSGFVPVQREMERS